MAFTYDKTPIDWPPKITEPPKKSKLINVVDSYLNSTIVDSDTNYYHSRKLRLPGSCRDYKNNLKTAIQKEVNQDINEIRDYLKKYQREQLKEVYVPRYSEQVSLPETIKIWFNSFKLLIWYG